MPSPLGPFKCYITQMGVGECVKFSGKKRYEGVRFNVISVTRGWVGVQFPEKNVTVCQIHSVRFGQLLRCAHKCIVGRIKVYVERNNITIP